MPHSSPAQRYTLGFWFAIGAALGFSVKAILVKLAYAVPAADGAAPVAAITLLALRMLIAAPAFGIAALRTQSAAALTPRQWLALNARITITSPSNARTPAKPIVIFR